MNSLTKEQIKLFTVIGCAIMLLSFLAIPAISAFGGFVSFSMLQLLSNSGDFELGFFPVLLLILALLAPIYVILLAYKDQPQLAALKPALPIDLKIGTVVLAVLGVILFIALATADKELSTGAGAWIYMLVGIAACALNVYEKK